MSERRRIRLDLEYLGTSYHGWQWQANALSVQEVVESALAKVAPGSGRVHAAGRTDTGVHALGQVAHFDTSATIPDTRLTAALRGVLPWDVRVRSASDAAASFHARFDALAKTYAYRLRHADSLSPFEYLTTERVSGALDREAMSAAAPLFQGRHDFAHFSAHPAGEDATRTVHSARLEWQGDLGVFEVRGSGFLRGLVRRMVGALLAVGAGRASGRDLAAALAGEAPARWLGGLKAAAKGLTLASVEYPPQSSTR